MNDLTSDEADSLLEATKRLVGEVTWPSSTQGEMCEWMAQDLIELCDSMRTLALEGKWTSAIMLKRSIAERSHMVLAVALDKKYSAEIEAYWEQLKVSKFQGRSRKLVEGARSIVARWNQQDPVKVNESLKTIIQSYKIDSEIHHHSLGFTRLVDEGRLMADDVWGMVSRELELTRLLLIGTIQQFQPTN